jgi:hypothetical protein
MSSSTAMDLLYNKKIETKKPSKIYLNIPYKLKDEIKKLYPIKWEITSKQWYIIEITNDEVVEINKLIENYELNNPKPKKKLYSYIL